MTSTGYEVLAFPKIRRLMEDGGRLAREKHLIHGLFEMDVTEARRVIHAYRASTGAGLSFTAFVLACVGRAVAQHKSIQAYRAWGDTLILFDDVDINVMVEVEANGQKIIRPYIVRAANKKTVQEIHAEIRAFQTHHTTSRESILIDWFVLLPGVVRRALLRLLFRNPHWLKKLSGTVALSSVGMFGTGGGWGIPVTNHTIQLTLGGIAQRPALVNGQLTNREMLSVTISIDHDLVDGAPAARFTQTLKELVEAPAMLNELVAQKQ
jgi:pyruvate/2-oxoglutarate dehydrogenase complex dihydrolipoamide acyltransferase (E2) component